MSTILINDFLNRLRTSTAADQSSFQMPTNKLVTAVAARLQAAGFLKLAETKEQTLTVDLNPKQPISRVKVLTKPSLRRYSGYQSLPRPVILGGLVLVSTPKGVLTGDQARKQKVGGELICEVW
ncbi:MAG: 30S ribosomal protein S8 [Patescibacteria group bacterium]